VAGKLKDTKDPEDAQSDEGSAEVLVVGDAEADVVGQDGDDVDDGHDAADVLTAQGSGVKTEHVLTGEQHHTGSVKTEQFNLDTQHAPMSHTYMHANKHTHMHTRTCTHPMNTITL